MKLWNNFYCHSRWLPKKSVAIFHRVQQTMDGRTPVKEQQGSQKRITNQYIWRRIIIKGKHPVKRQLWMIIIHNKYENMDNKFWQVLDFTTKLPKDKEESELRATKKFPLSSCFLFLFVITNESNLQSGLESWELFKETTTEITQINQTQKKLYSLLGYFISALISSLSLSASPTDSWDKFSLQACATHGIGIWSVE